MTTLVVDIDLDSPLPTLDAPDGGLLALVRRGGLPAGMVRVRRAGPLAPAALAAAIAAQVRELPAPPPPQAGPISIVVCTRERPDDLARCLQALRPIAAAGHEVIVVDNAPATQRSAAVASRFPYRYLREHARGLDNARNCGLRAASHPIVAFTDDDAAPDPRWPDALAAPLADPAVGCVTGLVMPIELETCAQELFELYCAGRRVFEPRSYAAPQTPPAAAGVCGMGANMALRRDLALALGGFDPRLDGGTATESGGDTDMFARVLAAGARIQYTPAALVWHRHRREPAELQRCLFGYGVGLYAFLTKRLLEAHDFRATEIAARWLLGPLVKAAVRRARGGETLPAALLLCEASGALVGPIRLYQETRQWKRQSS